MSQPTVADVYLGAAEILGDPDQQVVTDAKLRNALKTALGDLYRLMDLWNLPRIKTVAYYTLPAYTNILIPSLVASNIASPTKVWERGTLTTATVTNVTNTTPIVITVSDATGINTNDEATVSGVVGPTGLVNGIWRVTVSGTSITLNGSVAAGVYSSGGTVTVSDQQFVEMDSVDELDQTTPTTSLRYWRWRDGAIHFPASSQERQLKIEYETSATVPASGTIQIEDSLDYLKYRTASLVALKLNMADRAKTATFQALGASMEPDGSGGMLRTLCLNPAQERHKRARAPGRYRERRNRVWG